MGVSGFISWRQAGSLATEGVNATAIKVPPEGYDRHRDYDNTQGVGLDISTFKSFERHALDL